MGASLAFCLTHKHRAKRKIIAGLDSIKGKIVDYNEMLFAAKVNEMAQALHAGTIPHEIQTGPVPELVKWLRDSPAERIPDILAQQKSTAQRIREIEATSER